MMRKQQAQVSQVGLSIKNAVRDHPGIHFRGLGRVANVSSAGQLRHHLDRLERQGVLVEVEDGRYKRFFFAGDHDPKLRAEMARFARAVPRRIAKLLLVAPMNRTQLRRSLGCADSTLGYHLTRMVVLGDLIRIRGPNSTLYSLTSREQVTKILVLQGAAEAAIPAPQLEPELADQIPTPLRSQPSLLDPKALLGELAAPERKSPDGEIGDRSIGESDLDLGLDADNQLDADGDAVLDASQDDGISPAPATPDPTPDFVGPDATGAANDSDPLAL